MTGKLDHPYRGLPDYAFWKRAVAGVAIEDFDPVVSPPFLIGRSDAVATAGSCFAQHIARALAADGFQFLVTERPRAEEESHGASVIYSARYGNVYTTLQLRQLFDRAYGVTQPDCPAWTRPDGRLVDALRPNEAPLGFASEAELAAESERHLAQVREAFETCRVFVFTLGLTETWIADADGMAVPVAPNVVAAPSESATYSFRNLPVPDMIAQLSSFIVDLRTVNPGVRIVLTVSPVPLVATFEPRHVLVSTTYSKSALRVVAETVSQSFPDVAYFPSYEMVAMLPGADSFEDDLRSVKASAVARVMKVFKRRFTHQGSGEAQVPSSSTSASRAAPTFKASIREFEGVNCDEELLYPPEA